ncbi:hypothetical protein NKR23_g6620 [Pleurostoma richardsiae]|uniref:Extracellular membrane protein CFEM domain-containing protein n=1 Tax=Pleurostoma richardsiae TaxID=41990 RepID=A0AA38RP27_9PEZI|nr:hypothetical protein NKR23_g6620 [Pleurostoma richardsiae]
MRFWARFLAISALVLSPSALAAFQNDFSGYPAAAQQCLYDAADASGCSGDTVTEMNSCLCGNTGGFVVDSAACVGASDEGDVESVYETMMTHCDDSGTPLSVDKASFLAAAASAASTASTAAATKTKTTSETQTTSTTTQTTHTSTGTTSSASTATTTSSVSGHTATTTSTSGQASQTGTAGEDDNNKEDEGLSRGATIAIVAVSAVAGTAVVAAAIFFAFRYRRRKNQGPGDEFHPMLSQSQPYGGGGGGGGGGSVNTQPSSTNLSGAWTGWQQHDVKQYPYGPDDVVSYSNANLQPAVYELADHGSHLARPVEMPAIPAQVPGSAAPYVGAGGAVGTYEPYRPR